MWYVPLDLAAGRVLRISADQARASVTVPGWQTARPTSIYYKDLATIDDMKVSLTEDEGTGFARQSRRRIHLVRRKIEVARRGILTTRGKGPRQGSCRADEHTRARDRRAPRTR